MLLNSDHISPKEPLFSHELAFSPLSILPSLGFRSPASGLNIAACATVLLIEVGTVGSSLIFFFFILLISLPAQLIQCLHWESRVDGSASVLLLCRDVSVMWVRLKICCNFMGFFFNILMIHLDFIYCNATGCHPIWSHFICGSRVMFIFMTTLNWTEADSFSVFLPVIVLVNVE